MTRKDLIQNIHQALGQELSQRQIADVLDQLFAQVSQALVTEGRYTHPGFGVFTVHFKQAHTGRHPVTGEPLAIPESRTVLFKPSAELKAQLNR